MKLLVFCLVLGFVGSVFATLPGFEDETVEVPDSVGGGKIESKMPLVLTESGFPFHNADVLNINQTTLGRKGKCSETYEKLGAMVVENIKERLFERHSLTLVNLDFCGVGDREPGSRDVFRFVSLCVDVDDGDQLSSASLYFSTQGENFCDDEVVLTSLPAEIWIH